MKSKKKAIILLSDGTGNGAGKRQKTNVWRLYQALNLHSTEQIAMYDDGVGSQNFLLFKLLGGAFGFGLKRNVIELYKFLCRNYERGDRIYLFGFSRGAFTVRILAALIAKKGLIKGFASEHSLHEFARQTYADFRRKYWNFQITRPFVSLYHRFRWRKGRNSPKRIKPRIEFIGVWDTVGAYGLPVEELRVLWDRLIYPLRFQNADLSPKVRRACHAISIDDERHTFHPILWDESGETDPRRIEQVWFPGAHGDVSGGYARQELALVSLDWMISKVERQCGGKKPELIFDKKLRKEFRHRKDWNGKQHDSRAGLRAFYRYKPRDIEAIRQKTESKKAMAFCNQPNDRWSPVFLPKIHRSVFERIKARAVPYAPTGLPARYRIVDTMRCPATPASGPTRRCTTFESRKHAKKRHDAMNYALDVILKRCWLYYAFLVTSLTLIAFPLLVSSESAAHCTGIACLLAPACELARIMPLGFGNYWVTSLCQNMDYAFLLIAVFVLLIFAKRCLSASTFIRASAARSRVKREKPPPNWHPTTLSRLRYCRAGFFGNVMRSIWWCLVFLLIVLVIIAGIDRAVFSIRDCAGHMCETADVQPLEAGTGVVEFSPEDPYMSAGFELVQGVTYRLDVDETSDWMDGSLPAGPDGLTDPPPLIMHLFVPFRRHPSRPWFELTGRIGHPGEAVFDIGAGTCYTAQSGGPLYLYVNDAVFGLMPGKLWAFPYSWSLGPNRGDASIEVTAMKTNTTLCRD